MNIPPSTPKVIPGYPIPTRALTRLAEMVARFARATVSGGMSALRMAGIPFWDRARNRGIFVRLIGDGSPYDGVEVRPIPGGAWEDVAGGIGFDANLWNVNADTGPSLDGKYVECRRGGAGWYWFAFRRKGITPPPLCPPTFLVVDCAGNPIVGAQIKFFQPIVPYTPTVPIPELDGETDGSGLYTTPDITAELAPFGAVPQIAYGDVLYNVPFAMYNDGANCTSVRKFCYYKSEVTITTEAGAEPYLNNIGVPSGPTVTGEGTGSITIKQEGINPYRNTPPNCRQAFPNTGRIRIYPTVPGYRDVCVDVTFECMGHTTADAPMYYFEPCYVDGLLVTGSGRCAGDLGCDYGMGPNYRGVLSKAMEVQFTSLDGSNRFAGDEGQWIDLSHSYVYDPTFPTVPIADVWSSGCRGANGNYVSFGGSGCLLNQTTPYQTRITNYGSTKVDMSCGSITYSRFGEADCTTVTPCVGGGSSNCGCGLNAGGTLCSSCQTSAVGVGSPNGVTGVSRLQAPCDFTMGILVPPSIVPNWQVRIREKC